MAWSQISLNLINRSQDLNNTEYVIFQKNVAEDFSELAVAWRVVQNLGIGDNHPFAYPLQFYVSAGDSWGNFTPQMAAVDGQAYDMVKSTSGDVLQLSATPASSLTEVEVRNNLQTGGISANVFRDGKKLATKTNISPGQKAVFEFLPRIFIGAASQIVEGQVMNSAIISQINTELDLFGISSADIVIADGDGNRGLPIDVEPGRRYCVSRWRGGGVRVDVSPGDDPASVEIVNGLETEAAGV
ncbi:MAG: hypothetical protein HC897_17115, partial [Thermoanaerobaculia bacterium]|nr:hypothetical protein [Thermoanaerobaculia bacterium]